MPGEGKYWQSLEGDFSVCEDQEFVGRLLAMCTVESSSGLSQVYNTILKPNKANFYQTPPISLQKGRYDGLIGTTFDKLQSFFPRCVVCGIVRDGAVLLAPEADLEVFPTDSILVFANEKSHLYATRTAEKPAAAAADSESGMYVCVNAHI